MYALEVNGQDDLAAEIIEVVFLRLLDECSGWEEIYAHTTKLLLQVSQSHDDSQQRRIRHLIREAIARVDRSRRPGETQTDVLAAVFNRVATVRSKFRASEEY